MDSFHFIVVWFTGLRRTEEKDIMGEITWSGRVGDDEDEVLFLGSGSGSGDMSASGSESLHTTQKYSSSSISEKSPCIYALLFC